MAKMNTLAGLPTDYVPVTPNDSTDNLGEGVVLGLYIGSAGDVVVDTIGGTRTIPCTDNMVLPLLSADRVRSTGTTASNIFVMKA